MPAPVPSHPAPLVEARDLARRFGRRQALADLTFDLHPGEAVALLGPNGSGKTTLLRILAGIIAPTDGSLAIAACDALTNSLNMRRHIAYLPERPALPPEMTVRSFLQFRAAIKGLDSVRARSQVRVALQQCRLEDHATALIGTLSLGYQRRVGFADCLLADPLLMLLDEPHAGLDWPTTQILRDWIAATATTRTVLFSTHQLPEAVASASRALILSRGRLAADLPLRRGRVHPSGESLSSAYARLTGLLPTFPA
ncbi:MAG: ABC transporter ATP-binding protein [Kiritimatiellae bacterium]|nr:ABC transporter ATP-binding protein [Kiritimatiellia bacterium]